MLSSFLRRPLRIDESLTHCYSPMREIAVNRVSRTQNEWLVLPEFVHRQETFLLELERGQCQGAGVERNQQEWRRARHFPDIWVGVHVISWQISGRVKTLWFWGGGLSSLRRQGTALKENQSCSQCLLPPWCQLERKDKSPDQPEVLLDARASTF